MRFFEDILDTIGGTPLVKLGKVSSGYKSLVLGKLEFFNPGGSVKDRIGILMIRDAEKSGKLKPGGTIVEATSGNTGVGLAVAAAVCGYKSVFTMPDKMSKEKVALLKAFGAHVITTPTAVPPDSPESFYSVAERIARETPNSILVGQYFNQVNPETHYETTGPEIWEDTKGRVTHFLAGMGTGGTLSGAGKFLKEKNPEVKVIGVDPEGSILAHYFKTGELCEGRVYDVEGIGEDMIPGTLWLEYVDDMITVSDRESFQMARRLSREEGILAGGSSGTAVAAALRLAENLTEDDVIVVILPDTGERYLSKFHDDDWMNRKGLL